MCKSILILPVYKKEYMLKKLLLSIPINVVDQVLIIWDLPDDDDINEITSLNLDVVIKKRKERLGIGSAIMLGINYTLKNKFDKMIIMAGNGKDDPKQIKRFLIALNDYQYIQGSRWIRGGRSENLPKLRKFIIKMLTLIWSLLLNKNISEVTNGYRGFRSEIFLDERIAWNNKSLNGYQLEYYLNYAIIKNNFSHKEIPVSKRYVKNVNHSKIKLFDAFEILGPMIKIPILDYLRNKKIKAEMIDDVNNNDKN